MKLMILDGNSIINRAFYGVRPAEYTRRLSIPMRSTVF